MIFLAELAFKSDRLPGEAKATGACGEHPPHPRRSLSPLPGPEEMPAEQETATKRRETRKSRREMPLRERREKRKKAGIF